MSINESGLNGIVTDSYTKELPVGASIRISGTTVGTQSDVSGQFEVKIPGTNLDDSLIFTYVGYERYAEHISKLRNNASR